MSLDEVFSKILKTTEKTIPQMKAKVVFIGKKKKKKEKNWPSQKTSFYSSTNSQYFFAKAS